MYACYALIAIAAIIFTVINPKAVFIAIGAGLFVVIGSYQIAKTFKRRKP